jgi:hypothetical protein
MVTMSPTASPAAVPRRRPARPRRGVRFQQRRIRRRRAFTVAVPASQPARMSDNVRLFASTFAAGFLFVSVLIG